MSPWNEEPVVFECEGERLVGILHRGADADAKVGVVIVVGGPQYRVGSHRQFVLMARAFAAAGFPVLRFDHRGVGDAEGSSRSFQALECDITAAVRALSDRFVSLSSVVLWGLCDAASGILLAIERQVPANGIVLVNPWIRTEAGLAAVRLKHYYGTRLLQRSFWEKVLSGDFRLAASIKDVVRSVTDIGAGRLRASRSCESPYTVHMRDAISAFPGPVLVLLSEHDLTAKEFILMSRSDPQWRRALERPQVMSHMLAGADHTFSRSESLREATKRCTEWLRESATIGKV